MDAVEFRGNSNIWLTKAQRPEGPRRLVKMFPCFESSGRKPMFALMRWLEVPATALKCDPDSRRLRCAIVRACATRLSQKKEALEYGGDRRLVVFQETRRSAKNDRTFLRLGCAEPLPPANRSR